MPIDPAPSGHYHGLSEGLLDSPWLFGAAAAGVAGSAAVLVARQKRKGEWDIEEITDDV
jgi:hypothetical protein